MDVFQCAICRAGAKFSAGQQVFIYYGARNNSDFLLHDGFVYDENLSTDYVRIKLGLSKSDKLFEEKAKVLSQFVGLQPTDNFELRFGQNPLSDEILAFVKVFLASEEQIKEVLAEKKLGKLLIF